jgi:hypothetical protein
MSMNLALVDAANNCVRENAQATLTLKSGVQFTGKLEKPSPSFPDTVHLKTPSGWVTIDRDELAAVASHKP